MKTILVVDDEPSTLDLLHTLLDEQGYRVLSAGDGQAALEMLGRERIDLIIADAMMPRLVGVEMIRAMRARPELRAVPAILISAALVPSLAGLDPCRFLPKPFDLAELLDAITSALNPTQA